MPRRVLKKLLPTPGQLQGHWLLRHFGERLLDPRLWALHRRAITGAFGVGIAICFIPLPVHLVVAVLIVGFAAGVNNAWRAIRVYSDEVAKGDG